MIETKNWNGFIYGEAKDKNWTQITSSSINYEFMNPLRQNYNHIKALEKLIYTGNIHSIIAFVDGKFGTEMPDNVMHVSAVRNYILNFKKSVISPVTARKIVNIL